jgi:hypothetical protein
VEVQLVLAIRGRNRLGRRDVEQLPPGQLFADRGQRRDDQPDVGDADEAFVRRATATAATAATT